MPKPLHCVLCVCGVPQADKLDFVRSKVEEWQQSLRFEPPPTQRREH